MEQIPNAGTSALGLVEGLHPTIAKARWMGYTGRFAMGQRRRDKDKTRSSGRRRGREADFSTALLTKDVSRFGRNDDFWGGERKQTAKAWWLVAGFDPTYRRGAMDGAPGDTSA
jgi:hypothetical protein